MNQRQLIRIAALCAAIAVLLGAFGAHSLKTRLSPELLTSFETGVRYQFYHAFALLVCAMLKHTFPGKYLSYAALAFLCGIVLFSGSIYLLSTRSLTGLEQLTWLGPVTPIGGLMFMAGWILLLAAAAGKKN